MTLLIIYEKENIVRVWCSEDGYNAVKVFALSEKLARKRVCVTLTKPYLDAMERLIRQGIYVSRVEVIKDALRRLFRHYGIEVLEE